MLKWPMFTVRVGLSGSVVIPPDPTEPTYDFGPWEAAEAKMFMGHSLLDEAIHMGVYPTTFRILWNQIYPDHPTYLTSDPIAFKDTIAGAPIWWHWGVPSRHENSQPSPARTMADQMDRLVLTEGGPPPRAHYSPHRNEMIDTLDYLMRLTWLYLERSAARGKVANIDLWSIHPDTSGWSEPTQGADQHAKNYPHYGELGGFVPVCAEYENSFRYMANYVTWKMHQLRPDLPADWKVRVLPGSLSMRELAIGLEENRIPGFADATLEDFFDPDKIHPNPYAGYLQTCTMLACGGHVDLVAENAAKNLYAMNEQTSFQGTNYAPMPSAFAEWCQLLATTIAKSYGPCGWGGSSHNALAFDPEIHEDLIPSWSYTEADTGPDSPYWDVTTPTDPTGPTDPEVPTDHVLNMRVGNYAGPTLTGTQPQTVDDHFVLKNTALRAKLSLTKGFYGVAMVRRAAAPEGKIPSGNLLIISPNINAWAMPYGYVQVALDEAGIKFHTMSQYNGAPWPEGVDGGRASYGSAWTAVEFWVDGAEIGIKVGDRAQSVATTEYGTMGSSADIALFEGLDLDLKFIRLYDYLPTAEQRVEIVNYAKSI